MHVVALFVRYSGRGGSDYADRVARNEDISIGRFSASVEHDTVYPVSEYEERSLGREHADFRTCQFRNMVSPDTAGVDGDRRVVFRRFSRLVVNDFYARDFFLVSDEACHFGVYQYFGSV